MAFIWINPVADRMYEPEVLNEFLSRHGYRRFDIATDWLSIVKEKYREAVRESSKPVMDMRCPKAAEILEELGIASRVTLPRIHPILIHCGQEGSEREDLREETKIITTPCQSLADLGNGLGLKDTYFIPWNRFLEKVGSAPPCSLPESSPIPPGFFKELNVKTVSLTGEEEIRSYFEKYKPDEVQLVEMLYCKEGCHNGDGIRTCKK